MADVAISQKPTSTVTNHGAPSRVNGTWGWNTSCKVTSWAKNKKNKARATSMVEMWELGMGKNYKDKKGNWVIKNPRWEKEVSLEYTGKFTAWLNSGQHWSNGFDGATRQSFYPCVKDKNGKAIREGRVIYNLWHSIFLKNSKGRGAASKAKTELRPPRAPKLAAPVHHKEKGYVTCEITYDKGWNDNEECYDCYWEIWAKDTRRDESKPRLISSGENTNTKFTIRYDVYDRMNLTYSEYVEITFKAYTRGLRGNCVDSQGRTKWVTRTKVVSYPAQAYFYRGSNGKGDPLVVSGNSDNDKVTANIRTGATRTHPVTMVKLERLVNSDYEKAVDIPGTAEWEETGAVDNGNCIGLADSVANLRPIAGKHTWLRLKTIHDHEEMFYRYSAPWEVSALYRPPQTATDDKIDILSAIPGEDGESAEVLVGWNDTGDPATGTEITWSDYRNAWKSNEEPDNYEFTWSDGSITYGEKSYGGSATVYLKGLEKGRKYYIRARRYKDTEGSERTFSEYATAVVYPATEANSVVLHAPAFIPRGQSLALSWALTSDYDQTHWEILTGATKVVDVIGLVDGVETVIGHAFAWDGDTTIVEQGDDALGACVISAERLSGITSDEGYVPLSVVVSTGGERVESPIQMVGIADPPTISMTVPATVTAQAPSIEFTSSGTPNISLVITAQGTSNYLPSGSSTQVEGDTVYAVTLAPEWTLGTPNTTSITLPDNLELWDGSIYSVVASATDPDTLLVSESVAGRFEVEWEHQAPKPSSSITITPHDEIDADGNRRRYVTIQLVPPEDAAEGDLYDVYRVTPDGAYLIASALDMNAVVTDNFAPFGGTEKWYRVATVTADGDVDFEDYDYDLPGTDLRIDFGNRYVELPYNITIGDSYQKDFEARAHLGQDRPEGYWNENITRTASLATDVIKVADEEKIADLRDLAHYSGACFVRTTTGMAYQANVTVGGLDIAYNNARVAVSIDATEVALTDEYMGTYALPDPGDVPPETPVDEDVSSS